MKNLTIILVTPPLYILPIGMNGIEWRQFKRDYSFILEKFMNNAIVEKKHDVIIDLDSLQVLIDDFEKLKSFMTDSEKFTVTKKMSVIEWNHRRFLAKYIFTTPCILELDGSGFIKKVVAK